MRRERLLPSAQPCRDAYISQLLGMGMMVYKHLLTQHPYSKEGYFCSMPHTQPWGHTEKNAS